MSYSEFIKGTEFNFKIPQFPKGKGATEQIEFMRSEFGEIDIRGIIRILNYQGAGVPIFGKREVMLDNLTCWSRSFTNVALESAIERYFGNEGAVDLKFERDDDDEANEKLQEAEEAFELVDWLRTYCLPSAIIEVGHELRKLGYRISNQTASKIIDRLEELDLEGELEFDDLSEAIEAGVDLDS